MYKHIMLILTIALFQINAFAQPGSKGNRPDKSPQGYQIGHVVTDFELKDVDGTMYSLNSIEGAKGYIVIFTSNTCPFAVANEDRMIALHNTMAPKGYHVVAINSNDPNIEGGDSFEEMVVRHDEKNFPFLYLKDTEAVYKKFGANKTPHVFLLDNNLTVQYIGAIDDSARDPESVEETFVENAIAALENGESPNPSTTKAIGCPIKVASGNSRRGGRRGPPSPEMILERMDANKDNEITKDEARGPLAGDFDNLDENKDGKLTIAELKNLKKGPKSR